MQTTVPTPAHPAPETRAVRPGVGVVAAAVLFVLVVTGTGAANLLSEFVSGDSERTTTLVPMADRLVIDADAADVTLSPSADGNVHVHTVVRYEIGEPRLIEESTPSGVRLDADCEAMLATRCDFTYYVEVPPTFAVSVRGTAGDVTASELSGSVKVDRRGGDLVLSDLTGPIDVRVEQGDITGERLRSDTVLASTSRGDTRLQLLTAPRMLRADTDRGDIRLVVPGDEPYRVDLIPGSGEERIIGVPVDPAASRSITAESGSGSVSVLPGAGAAARAGPRPVRPVPPAPPARPAPPALPVGPQR